MKIVPLMLVGAAALLAAPAAAQQAADSVYELRGVEVAPRPLNGADMAAALTATYPAALKAAGVSGTVRVSIVVGTDGAARDARVLESADSAFNAPTLAAVQMLRFSPAELNDRPVSVRVELPVVWQAPAAEGPAAVAAAAGEGTATVAAAAPNASGAAPDSLGAYEISEVTVPPRPTNMGDLMQRMQATYPQDMRTATLHGTVQVRFIVGADGVVRNARVTRSTNSRFNSATLRALPVLRFSPGELNGQAVPVWVELPLRW